MDGINNYGFRVINGNNPLKKQNLNTLSVNYCALPASRMARRVYEYRDNNENKIISKENAQAYSMFLNNVPEYYYTCYLTTDSSSNSISGKAIYLANISNLNFNLISAVYNSSTVVLDSNDFNYSFSKSSNFITITNVNSSFDFSAYTLMFRITGENTYNPIKVNYKLIYTP